MENNEEQQRLYKVFAQIATWKIRMAILQGNAKTLAEQGNYKEAADEKLRARELEFIVLEIEQALKK